MSKHEEKPDIKTKAEKERDFIAFEKRERKENDVPDPPQCEPQLGDLTPDYIEWVRDNYPDDFEARYQGRIPDELLKHKPKKHKE
jgi:hypothetical protein